MGSRVFFYRLNLRRPTLRDRLVEGVITRIDALDRPKTGSSNWTSNIELDFRLPLPFRGPTSART